MARSATTFVKGEKSRKQGRPSTYDPDYCRRVQEYGAQGKSLT